MVEKISRLEKEASLIDDSYAEVHAVVFIIAPKFYLELNVELAYISEICIILVLLTTFH
jgi:hypothetical protein